MGDFTSTYLAPEMPGRSIFLHVQKLHFFHIPLKTQTLVVWRCLKMFLLFNWEIVRFHVNFQGCIHTLTLNRACSVCILYTVPIHLPTRTTGFVGNSILVCLVKKAKRYSLFILDFLHANNLWPIQISGPSCWMLLSFCVVTLGTPRP